VASQYFYCSQCHKKFSAPPKLFDTLLDFSRTAAEPCSSCGATRELHVRLDFQLGAGDGDFKVVHAFLPEKLDSWLGEEEEEVTYYPFLVVLQRAGESKQFCWMPYWHLVGNEARFGQHAVCLDQRQLESLVAQAAEKTLAFA
jgi:hypothetical protein